jgi:hypothetical protein
MDILKKIMLPALAVLVLVLFAAIWIWIGVELLFFDGKPPLSFDQAQVEVAGFLASAVGAGTASVLGIEIHKAGADEPLLAKKVGKAFAGSLLLVAGVATYAIVGVFVLAVWVFNSTVAPDMIGAFALGVLGWLSGAFTAVFRTEN